MPPASPKITCLFFTEPSLPAWLSTPAGRGFAGDLLVECSPRPALGFVLNLETPANYPGVAGLLGGVDIGTLAHAADALPSPILLAPGAPVAPMALRAALARLARPDERLQAITLAVPVSEARILGSALAVADRFAIAWDATACPHDELIDFACWLSAERLLTPRNFAGLHTYTVGAPPPIPHVQRVEALLRPLGGRMQHIAA